MRLTEPGIRFECVSRDVATKTISGEPKGSYIIRPSSVRGALSVTYHGQDDRIGHTQLAKETSGWLSPTKDNVHYATLRDLLRAEFYGIAVDGGTAAAPVESRYAEAPPPAESRYAEAPPPAGEGRYADVPPDRYADVPPEDRYADVPPDRYADVPAEGASTYDAIPKEAFRRDFFKAACDVILMTEPGIDFRNVDRAGAESILSGKPPGTALVRPPNIEMSDMSTTFTTLVLSFVAASGKSVKSVRIVRTARKTWALGGSADEEATTVRGLLEKLASSYGLRVDLMDAAREERNLTDCSDLVQIAVSSGGLNQDFKFTGAWQPDFTRGQAEAAIRESPEGDVGLIRPGSKTPYAITYRLAGAVYNTPITVSGDRYVIVLMDGEARFESVSGILAKLGLTPYSKGVEHMYDDIPDDLKKKSRP